MREGEIRMGEGNMTVKEGKAEEERKRWNRKNGKENHNMKVPGR